MEHNNKTNTHILEVTTSGIDASENRNHVWTRRGKKEKKKEKQK